MKVILVNPLWTWSNVVPLNLAELAGYIRNSGWQDIEIVDLNCELKGELEEDIIGKAVRIITLRRPDVIGITCNTIHLPFCAEFCRQFKKTSSVPIVIGGIHPTFAPEETIRLSGADYLVRGEGEETFRELLSAIENNRAKETIAGISFMRDGKIRHNPGRELIRDLSILPFPAFDLLLPYLKMMRGQKADYEKEVNVSLSASRGCHFGCSFCSVHQMWRFQRRKPVKRVIEEIAYAKKEFRCDSISFSDDCLTFQKKWFLELLSGIRKARIGWSCFSRVDTISQDWLARMRQAGCVKIYHGIESASPRIRKIIDKKVSLEIDNKQIRGLIKREINSGIIPTCSFILGHPAETREEVADTLNLAVELRNMGSEVHFQLFTPFPGLPMTRIYQKRIIRFDKLKHLRETSIHLFEQMFLYRKFIFRYRRYLPDAYIFEPGIGLKEFIGLYLEGKKRIGRDNYRNKILHHYIDYRGKRKLLVEADRKIPLDDLKRAGRNSSLFLKVDDRFGLSGSRSAMIKINPGQLVVSLRLKKGGLGPQRAKEISAFLKELSGLGKKIIFTRPVPKELLREVPADKRKLFIIPKDCLDCREMFKVNRRGKIELCTGREVCDAAYLYSPSGVYDLFIKLGSKENPGSDSLCFFFPRKKEFLRLYRKMRKGVLQMNWAKSALSASQYKKAAAYIIKAKRNGYKEGSEHFMLGLCLEKMGRFRQAVRELLLASKINPADSRIHLSLSNCYKRLGMAGESQRELESAYRLLKNPARPEKSGVL